MTVFQSSWLAGVATQFELIQDLVFRKVESHPRVRRPQRVERGFFPILLSICRAHSNSVGRSDVLIVGIQMWFYQAFEILRQLIGYP